MEDKGKYFIILKGTKLLYFFSCHLLLWPRSMIHKSEVVNGWCVPFMGSDRSVVLRSQRHFYEKDHERPAQVQSYVAFKSLLTIAILAVVGAKFSLLARSHWGRALLLKYPRFFSVGLVSHEGPSEECADNARFAVHVHGQGWQEKLAEPTDSLIGLPNKKMTVKVSGKNPAYAGASLMLVMSAFVCLTEYEKMPSKGGVYAPGAAFAKTSLIQRLHERGIRFEVTSSL